MELNKTASVREMLEQLPTQTLEDMLQQELHREEVDGNAIRMIQSILRSRTPPIQVEITPQVRKAWEVYQRKVAAQDAQIRRRKTIRTVIWRTASTAAIAVLLLATFLPKEAEAETLWERLVRWTSGIAEFFSTADNEGRQLEYEFKTDNPGLQQVYEAVIEMGVTVPVVPTWLPENSELIECKQISTSRKSGIMARLNISDNSELILEVDCYNDKYAHTYQKVDTEAAKYENSGISHSIVQNNGRWVVIWNRDNIECCIAVDCPEETLSKILESIYVMEAK